MNKSKRGRNSHGQKSKLWNCRIPIDVLEEAKINAAEEGNSLSSIVIDLLRKWNETKKGGQDG